MTVSITTIKQEANKKCEVFLIKKFDYNFIKENTLN